MRRYFNIFKKLIQIANGRKFVIVQMFISSCMFNLFSLLPPIATAGIIAMITGNNFSGVWYYAFLYIVFYVMYFSSLHWNYHTYSVLNEYYHLEVQKMLFEKVANNDAISEKISKGKILETCSDDVRYLVDVIDTAVDAATGILKLFIVFIIFIYYNVFVAICVLILDLLYLKLMNVNSKNVSKYYEGTRKYEDKIVDVLNQMLTSLKQVKVLNLMPKLDLNIDKTRNKWKKQYRGKRKSITARYCLIPYIVYFGKLVLYIFLAYLVINDEMTLDQLVLLISYFEMTITCMDETLECLLNLGNYGVRVNRIKTVLSYESLKEVDFGDVTNDYINGVVEFKDVVFNVKNNNILNKVTFKIYPNEINTIVGKSGSGKTTIINLLSRTIRLKSGEILIDGENIYNYSKNVYSSNVQVVYQKPFVFDMSIRENLSLVDEDFEHQKEACMRVGIHDFIESLPKGYNTIIGETQYAFSEGNKQLLAIARAILSGAEILLFDEITSNIDPVTSSKIGELILDLKTDHTIIMVTHKPEMMALSDRIIVLDKGRVVCKGLNKSVYNKNALYRDLKNRTFASVSEIHVD